MLALSFPGMVWLDFDRRLAKLTQPLEQFWQDLKILETYPPKVKRSNNKSYQVVSTNGIPPTTFNHETAAYCCCVLRKEL